MFRTCDLSSKDAYLQWVREWKEEYKKVSTRLRELRIELSKPHVLSIIDYGRWKYTTSSATPLLSEAYPLRIYARQLLELRKSGKELSWAEKQKRKELAKQD